MASHQRGQTSADQILAGGISDDAIYRLLASGHLHRRHRGVYAVGHTAQTPLAAETAALLACGPGAVLSHVSAGVLWKIITHDDGLIHVTIPRRHHLCLEGVRVHRTCTLTPADVRIHENLPVTSPARTLLDLADLFDHRDLERALDEALVQRLTSRGEIERTIARANGRRGAGRLKRALARHALPQVTVQSSNGACTS